MSTVRIALVEPEHEVNVGHVARLMKNFGLKELLLVGPRFELEKAKIFATHGKGLLSRAREIEFSELDSFEPLIGTTAIRARDRLNLTRDTVDPWELAKILARRRNTRPCIVLGREATGLTNEELSRCDIVVNIDTTTDYKTLNIAHALAILLYEMYSREGNQSRRRRSKRLATRSETQLVIDYALSLAGSSGLRMHKLGMLELALKRMMSRSMATSKEAMLLVSLLRGAVLAIRRGGR